MVPDWRSSWPTRIASMKNCSWAVCCSKRAETVEEQLQVRGAARECADSLLVGDGSLAHALELLQHRRCERRAGDKGLKGLSLKDVDLAFELGEALLEDRAVDREASLGSREVETHFLHLALEVGDFPLDCGPSRPVLAAPPWTVECGRRAEAPGCEGAPQRRPAGRRCPVSSTPSGRALAERSPWQSASPSRGHEVRREEERVIAGFA